MKGSISSEEEKALTNERKTGKKRTQTIGIRIEEIHNAQVTV